MGFSAVAAQADRAMTILALALALYALLLLVTTLIVERLGK